MAGDVCAESESPGGERERVLLGAPHLLRAAGAAEAAGGEGWEASCCPVGGCPAWEFGLHPISDAKPGGRTFRVPVNRGCLKDVSMCAFLK